MREKIVLLACTLLLAASNNITASERYTRVVIEGEKFYINVTRTGIPMSL